MSTGTIFRFLGDPIGYITPERIMGPPYDSPCWQWVEVGHTGRRVWVDIAKAYSVEPFEPPES